ncbi:MAG: protein jag [Chloroflexi bacterium]|nr:protein jag [Chloroflexota bacterium]
MESKNLEVTAKTVEEAVELALRQLDASREEVEVEVVSRGRAGILGIGSEPARVRVSRLQPGSNVASQGMEVLNKLLSLMGVSAIATIRHAGDEVAGEPPTIDITGEDSGLLIGRRGETLRTLQFMVSFLLSRQLGSRAYVAVDVEQYREKRYNSLRALARRVAERVVATGRPATLEPMPAAERRIIHMALADHPRVTTQSVGEGDSRQVSIRPRDKEAS